MIVILLAPFTVFTVVAFSGLAGWSFSAGNWLLLPDKPDYMECGLLLLWNMGMWESAAACAGEVRAMLQRPCLPTPACCTIRHVHGPQACAPLCHIATIVLASSTKIRSKQAGRPQCATCIRLGRW
jgi:hypothetical protein